MRRRSDRPPSIATLVAKARAGRPDGVSVIIADNRGNPMLATMLATRLPDVLIYAHAQDGPETLDARRLSVACRPTG